MIAAIAAIVGMVGFVAIYVIVGLGDNGVGENDPAPQAVDAGTPAGLVRPVEPARPETAASETQRRLNRGAMATFVFKDEPAAMPAITFNGPDGKPRTLTDWRGKVVLLNLWATWCAPCRREMPHLDRLKAKLGGENFDVVAVSVDRGGAEKPKAFLAEMGISALQLYQDPTAQLGFTLMAIGMPATLLIDREGREIGRLVGPAEWDGPDAVRLIQSLLDRAPQLD